MQPDEFKSYYRFLSTNEDAYNFWSKYDLKPPLVEIIEKKEFHDSIAITTSFEYDRIYIHNKDKLESLKDDHARLVQYIYDIIDESSNAVKDGYTVNIFKNLELKIPSDDPIKPILKSLLHTDEKAKQYWSKFELKPPLLIISESEKLPEFMRVFSLYPTQSCLHHKNKVFK
jgi:hypothetical protein